MATTTKRKTTTKKKKVENVEEKPKQKCPCCGRELEVTNQNFYKSYSQLYKNSIDGRMVICKDCIGELGDMYREQFQSELKVTYHLCQLLDVYFDKRIYKGACSQIQKLTEQGQNRGAIYKTYFQKVLSLPQYKGKTFIDSDPLTDEDTRHEDELSLGLNKVLLFVVLFLLVH